MLTPQQIQDTSFEKALFGGYDMDSVDDFLEPLTEDYITLYKENSVLKSKMRILVEKLEEYRKNETSVQSALLAAQKTCDQMVAEAERKCTQMLHEAEETAEAKHTEELIAEEEKRLASAQAPRRTIWTRRRRTSKSSLRSCRRCAKRRRSRPPRPSPACISSPVRRRIPSRRSR